MVWKRGRPLDKSGIGPQGRIAIRGPSVLTVLAVLPGFSKGGGAKASALIWATGHASATTSGPIRTSIGSGNTWALSSCLLIDGRGNALSRPSCSTRWDEGSACLADYDDPAPLVGAIG